MTRCFSLSPAAINEAADSRCNRRAAVEKLAQLGAGNSSRLGNAWADGMPGDGSPGATSPIPMGPEGVDGPTEGGAKPGCKEAGVIEMRKLKKDLEATHKKERELRTELGELKESSGKALAQSEETASELRRKNVELEENLVKLGEGIKAEIEKFNGVITELKKEIRQVRARERMKNTLLFLANQNKTAAIQARDVTATLLAEEISSLEASESVLSRKVAQMSMSKEDIAKSAEIAGVSCA